jgi:hypothetical protein
MSDRAFLFNDASTGHNIKVPVKTRHRIIHLELWYVSKASSGSLACLVLSTYWMGSSHANLDCRQKLSTKEHPGSSNQWMDVGFCRKATNNC